MLILEKLTKKSTVIVKWYYKKGDYQMMEEGTRYEQLTELDIKLIEEDM